mgnify:CR=1 FL=1
MREIRAEIIAVGTELLLGQIANTNAAWLSEKLADYGVNVYYHAVVGDNLNRVKTTFETASNRSDLVFVTGGLGPTEDDLTREAFAALTGMSLVEDKDTISKITSFFNKSNRIMTPNNRKQAVVFKDSLVFQNSVGIAPGIVIDYNRVTWVFMPGVPREMKAITTEHIVPYLIKKFNLNTVIESRMLRFIGIGESQIEHQLKALIEKQHNPTIAPLATEGEVAIRLTAKAESKEQANLLIDQIEAKVLAEVGDYFYGYNEESVNQKVVQLLKEKSLTIAAAESLTGGKFVDTLVTVSGASNVCKGGIVCYTTDIKQEVLGVSKKTIETDGTVSETCAKEMAVNIKGKMQADIGISFTGVAGPTPIEGKSVGTVFICLHLANGEAIINEYHFHGDRDTIRTRTVKKGLETLYHYLLK